VSHNRPFRDILCTVVIGAALVAGLVLPASAQSRATQTATRAAQQTPAPTAAKKPAAPSAAAKRRAAARRARAAAAARALREAQEPRYKLDEAGALVPDLRAEAAIIYDPESGEVLWEQNALDQRSIASITKVMTAVVFLENGPDLTEQVVVQRADVRRASTTYLRAGFKLTTGDLLHLLLIGSDNAAARVLARVSPLGSEGFIDRMNEKAAEFGLSATSYADPSGLLNDNLSSALDMARLIAFAGQDERLSGIMRLPRYSFLVGKRTITVNSTNQLVTAGGLEVLGGKTGFIRRSGYCLAALLRLPEGDGSVAVVVLGARSNAGRFWETRHLFNWFTSQAHALANQAHGLLSAPLEAAGLPN
jgi:D-alanyl-D-alanine endopeptidase (penicillin-binding protein 7)